MALCTCKCLNVTLESDKLEDFNEIEKLELSPTEQRDIFFSEKLLSCPADTVKSYVAQPALCGRRTVGRFVMESCLACGQTTHAVLQDKNLILLMKLIQTTSEQINNLKKSNNFSPVFNLLVPEVTNDIEMKENVDTNNKTLSDRNGSVPPHQLVIGTLSKQLNQTLQSQLEVIEETVRQFRDQKYAEYEAYKERAHRDHEILSSIVSKAKNNTEKDNWNSNTILDNSAQLSSLQRRRMSSIKDSKKIPHIKPSHIPHEEDSLDSEDIFDLEGADFRNNMISDQDDYDSDDGSNDEGIHISRPRGGVPLDMARSLPIDMPKFPNNRPAVREIDDYEETQDIAASIKALARSEHGDVFELPRPRFSTQI